jgi:hypothetical protein
VEALAALVPSVGVGLLFWFAVRAMVNGDRREREALARMEREERNRSAGQAPLSPPSSSPGNEPGTGEKSGEPA